jgi:predicted acetyltransferase
MVIPHFIDPGPLIDDDLSLVVEQFHEQISDSRWVPYYRFRMLHTRTRYAMGNCSLRLGNTLHIVMYAGHIGYGVEPEYRGHHYAARAVRLLLPHALRHGINPVWITCNPDNLPSRRSCEIAGGHFVEIVDLPRDNPMYQLGERQKCRFRWDL